MSTVRISLEEVVGYYDELEDPHSTINQKHPFVSVVVIALMAVLAGASGPTTIAQWAKYQEAFLLRVLDLPNGVPRKDVFRRVLSLFHPTAFSDLLLGQYPGLAYPGLALVAQESGRRGDRDQTAHLCRRWQDGAATIGRRALAHCIG